MGIFSKNEPLVISNKFGYLPLRDPRQQPAEVIEIMPRMKANKAGEEFLQKYLAVVRTRLPRDLVEEWVIALSGDLDDFIHLAENENETDEFLGFMMQGFAMGTCEDTFFKIGKLNQMTECAWEAMLSMVERQAMQGEDFRGQSCLNALLAGYFLARTTI